MAMLIVEESFSKTIRKERWFAIIWEESLNRKTSTWTVHFQKMSSCSGWNSVENYWKWMKNGSSSEFLGEGKKFFLKSVRRFACTDCTYWRTLVAWAIDPVQKMISSSSSKGKSFRDVKKPSGTSGETGSSGDDFLEFNGGNDGRFRGEHEWYNCGIVDSSFVEESSRHSTVPFYAFYGIPSWGTLIGTYPSLHASEDLQKQSNENDWYFSWKNF